MQKAPFAVGSSIARSKSLAGEAHGQTDGAAEPILGVNSQSACAVVGAHISTITARVLHLQYLCLLCRQAVKCC